MNYMLYKRYVARVEFDGEDEIFVGHLAGVADVVGFHADTVEGLKSAFREAVNDYLATCEKVGKPPERPYSGKVMFRISPEVHARAAIAAQLSGLGMNQWAEKALEEAARR